MSRKSITTIKLEDKLTTLQGSKTILMAEINEQQQHMLEIGRQIKFIEELLGRIISPAKEANNG